MWTLSLRDARGESGKVLKISFALYVLFLHQVISNPFSNKAKKKETNKREKESKKRKNSQSKDISKNI